MALATAAEARSLSALRCHTGLCPISSFMHLFLSAALGNDLRDIFLTFLVSLPKTVTDQILDEEERVQVDVARSSNNEQIETVGECLTLAIDRRLTSMAVKSAEKLKAHIDDIVAQRAEIVKV